MAEKTETTNWWSRQSKLVRVAIVVMGLIVVGLIIVVSLLAVGDEDGTVETAVTETTLAEETETTASSTTETETTEGPTTTTTEPTTTTTAAPTTTVPAPNVYAGSGDSVLDIEKPDDEVLIYVRGNFARSHFAVTGYGSDGEQTELFVNTTGPYEGVRALDFKQGQETIRLEINASGSWRVEIRSLLSARTVEVGDIIKGDGDDVFLIEGTPDTAIIEGNAAGSHFAVTAYGTSADLLVNTVDPYEGEVIVPPDSSAVEVQATGPWAVSMN